MKKLLLPLLTLCVCLLCGCSGVVGSVAPTPMPTATPDPVTETEGREMRLLWQNEWVEGTFVGRLNGDSPMEGTFTAPELTFSGIFSDGYLYSGELTADTVFVSFENEMCIGSYEGGLAGGQLAGDGVFTGRTQAGVAMSYKGGFGDGVANGQGELRYDDESRFDLLGNFSAGEYAPKPGEMLHTLSTRVPEFTLSEEQEAFLAEYPEVWSPYNMHRDFFDSGLPLVGENVVSLYNVCCGWDMPVAWMEEYGLRYISSRTVQMDARGDTVTILMASASEYYEYAVMLLIPGTYPHMTQGVRFHAIAMPIGFTDYVTTRGTEEQCLVEIAADVFYPG